MQALDFAAKSGREAPTLEPPRPARDEGEVLVVQTSGAQIGMRGEQIVVSVKREEVCKLPSQQMRAIYCFGAVQMSAQAVESCLIAHRLAIHRRKSKMQLRVRRSFAARACPPDRLVRQTDRLCRAIETARIVLQRRRTCPARRQRTRFADSSAHLLHQLIA